VSKPKDDKVQLHVELTRSQLLKFKVALKKMGYRTVSELVREHVRRVIAEAEAAQEEKADDC